MKIIKLVLSGYKWLFLNNISYIEYNPESHTQLILGSNGSGKSSLLRELNPIPADIKSDYNEGGFKEVHISKGDDIYVLSSGLVSKTKHSFKVNNKELNIGGTRRVQLALVKEHFNLTPKSNSIINGTITLSNMSKADRKDWLREMSSMDYTYAISLYNHLKSEHRNLAGGIKLLNEELNVDTSLLITPEEEKEFLTIKERSGSIIEDLMFSYSNPVPEQNNIPILATVVSKVEKLKERLDSDTFKGYSELNIENEIVVKETTISNLNKDIETISLELDKLSKIKKSKDVELLRKEILELKKQIEVDDIILNELKSNKKDIVKWYEHYKSEHGKIISMLEELKLTDNETMSPEEVKNLATEEQDSKEKLSQLKNVYSVNLNSLEALLNNKRDDNMIKCENCSHEFYYGYDEKTENKLRATISKLEDQIESLSKAYQETKVKYDAIVSRVKLLTVLRETYFPDILWLRLVKIPLTEIDSFTLSNNFQKLLIDLEDTKGSYEREIKLIDLENKLIVSEEVEKVKRDIDLSKIEVLEKELSDKTIMKIETTKALDNLKNYSSIKNTYLELISKIQSLLKDIKKEKKDKANNVINNSIRELVSKIKEETYVIENKLIENNKVKDRIASNRKLIETYKTKQDTLAITLKALSPTEGLIAKSINSFITKMVQDMNNIISIVWSYDMELLPCEVGEDNDLTYEFKVWVDNKETINDVSLLSTAMKDIVNLAFRIVFMKYCNLQDQPLILDEFAVSMDDKHRHNAYTTLNNVLLSNFNQVFIVSHFKSLYSRFLDSNVIILDKKNLDLPSDLLYNDKIMIS